MEEKCKHAVKQHPNHYFRYYILEASLSAKNTILIYPKKRIFFKYQKTIATGGMCELCATSCINSYKVHSNQLHSSHCVPNVNHHGITSVMLATLTTGPMSKPKSMLQAIRGYPHKIQTTNQAFYNKPLIHLISRYKLKVALNLFLKTISLTVLI